MMMEMSGFLYESNYPLIVYFSNWDKTYLGPTVPISLCIFNFNAIVV